MASELVDQIVGRLSARNQNRTEADIQTDVAMLLVSGELNLTDKDVVKVESQLGDGTRRRIDVEMGHLVIEVKKDLRFGGVLKDAEVQLAGYLGQREAELGATFAGVLTDGTSWMLYRVRAGALESVVELSLSEREPDADRLVVWLESIMATRVQVKPTPATIEELLGASSPAHQFDHAVLSGLLQSAKGDKEVSLKRELWSKLLKTAYGDAFQDDEKLFVNHTLLVITAEAIAHAIVGIDVANGLRPAELVSGDRFAKAQIYGVVEADFFDWPIDLMGGADFVSVVARRVARFNWSDVEHDVLKVLYESVIEQRDRESLGEYYTPDWLASAMVADRVTDPLDQRVLDPSCGSGTFVFHAVKAYLDAADAQSQSPGVSATQVTRHVFGIDIHPVAVTLARVTYLMAIGTGRLGSKDRGPLTIPVFLGDSLQWERHQDLFTDTDAVTISTSSEDLVEGGGGALFDDDLVFPLSVWKDGDRFDRMVDEMAAAVYKLSAGGKSARVMGPAAHKAPALASGINPILDRFGVLGVDRTTVASTFETWVGLQRSQRDRIWGYYVRNLVRPMWLARPENHVDVLIGNPPWLRYSKMTSAMQRRYKELAEPRKLLVGGLGASARDLSTLFVARSIELYLKDGGSFGFVMPFGILSRRPHTGFRAGDWRSRESSDLSVAFDQPWVLSGIKNIFPMNSSVVRGKHSPKPIPLSPSAMRWVGPTRGSLAHNVGSHDIAAIASGDLAASPYGKLFRQGAILVPRMLLFVEEAESGPMGLGAGRVEVRSARSAQEKKPWKHMEALSGVVEELSVRGVHLGETIAPFKSLTPRKAVLPLEPDHIMSMDEIASLPALSDWWGDVEAAWAEGRVATEELPLLQRFDYHAQLSAQLPVKHDRVVYTKSGNSLAAARLSAEDASIIDHKLYWTSCSSTDEALFLIGILNSKTLLDAVRKYQAVGLFGARDFDKYVFSVGIPIFDPSSETHQGVVEAARSCEENAAQLDIPKGTHFLQARRLVSGQLQSAGLWSPLESAIASVL
ncbi:MAG: N-6 DNA methylase [Propionibacteriaceae bacterium]